MVGLRRLVTSECFLLILFVAESSRGPCIPPVGKTYITIGQDLDSIIKYNQAIKISPHGVMSYASLLNLANASTALSDPIDYGSGTEWASGLTNAFPGAILQLGLWIVGMCKDIAVGRMDADIDALAQYLGRLDCDVLLRIGYEFDSQQNNYDPHDYIDAFQHIVNRFRAIGVPNTGFVWHASGVAPREGWPIADWFPGREYVDWCAVSFFQQPYACQVPENCKFEHAENVVTLCSGKHALPIMIAESTPFGGIVDESQSNKGPNRAGYSGTSWSAWFTPVMEFINNHDVKMWCYINCHWDAQSQWQRERAPGVHWGDSRVQKFPGVLRRWVDEVLKNSRYSWIVSDVAPPKIVREAGADDGAISAIQNMARKKELKNHNSEGKWKVCVVEDISRTIEPRQLVTLLVGASIAALLMAGAVGVFLRERRNAVNHEYVTIP